MKHDCKVLIYHPPKTQHSVIIPRCCSWPWMLWGSTPQESEMINTQGWFIGHNGSISNTRMALEKCVNWLQNTRSSLSITSVIWELHQVTNRLLVAASAFLKLLDCYSLSLTSIEGYNHAVIFSDSFGEYRWQYGMKTKDDILGVAKRWFVEIANLREKHPLLMVMRDNGGENTSKELNDFFT